MTRRNAQDTFTVDEVIDELGYRRPGDLLEQDAGEQAVTPARRQAWQEATERLGVTAAFFQGGVPLVYFKGLRQPADEDIELAVSELHRQSWNHGRAPFVVVVLPGEVRVLDSRTAPFDDFTLLRSTTTTGLEDFSYGSVISGRVLSRLQDRAPRRTVVDQLRDDLRFARTRLVDLGLERDSAKDLLGRSLFARYLRDRGVLQHVVGQQDASVFEDAGAVSVEAVYRLFGAIRERFNGDVFPVSEEERAQVTEAQLAVVDDFLRGTRGGQLPMVDYYDFSVIPAELVSSIYEEFLESKQKGNAAHYTPEHIVDLALEEVLSETPEQERITVLDPACGSGIFLARAYRRLIDLHETRLRRRLSPQELSELLANSVYGCDTMRSAVRVAAFSCYLVLLDHCRTQEIAEQVRFPALLDKNLFVGDFFELEDALRGPFDVVASNPPWMAWTPPAAAYVRENEKPAGDKQLAHAFLWGCLDHLAPGGQMVILMPAKALYNTSGPNVAFRRALVQETGLELVVDFSAFRHELFANAAGPMALMVLRGSAHEQQGFITFCTPRPTPLTSSTGRVVLTGDDIKRVPRREAARRPEFFKATLFGNFRDANLFERLKRKFPTLDELEDQGRLVVGAGYQIKGGDKHPSEFLRSTPRIESKYVKPFQVRRLSPPPDAETFHRPRNEDLFRGAHIVVTRTIDRDGFVQAAFLEEDASYNDSLIGLAAPGTAGRDMRALTAVLNSSVVRYLLFVSATSWGVERPRLEPQDLRALPISLPEGAPARRLAEIASRAAVRGVTERDRRAIDKIVVGAYGLSTDDYDQVRDLLTFGLGLHYRKAHAEAFLPPEADAMNEYAAVFRAQLAKSLGVDVDARLGYGQGPWATISIGLDSPAADVPEHHQTFASIAQDAQESSGTVVLRRTLRVYQPHGFVMTKPAEARHWTRSAARQDADDVVAECLRAAVDEEQASAPAPVPVSAG